MTGQPWTGQPGHDSRDKIVRQDNWDKSVWTGKLESQPDHVSLDKTERRGWSEHFNKDRTGTRQPGQDNSDRAASTGEQDSHDKTAGSCQPERTGRPAHDSKDMTARHPGQDSWDRPDGQDNQNITASTGQSGWENWGKRALRQAARTGHVGQSAEQLRQVNGGRTAMTEKIQQDG